MRKVIILLITILLLAACSQGEGEKVLEAKDVNEGVDRCDVCNMLVPNDYNATQIVLSDGRSLMFDDIGCMVKWEEENGLDDVNVRYVRDYHTQEWIIFDEATFAYDYSFRTPMAYGVYSFASKADAEKFVEEQGKGVVLSYSELQNHSWNETWK